MLKRNRQWWVLKITVISWLIMLPYFAYAADLKIGIVDTEKILRESVPAINAQKKIEQEFLPREDEAQLLAQQAKVLQEKLENVTLDITDTNRKALERELANLSREYQRAQRQIREDLSVRQNEEYGVILEQTTQTIHKIAENEGYDLILQKQEAVYRSERIDITEQVIQLLEKEIDKKGEK